MDDETRQKIEEAFEEGQRGNYANCVDILWRLLGWDKPSTTE